MIPKMLSFDVLKYILLEKEEYQIFNECVQGAVSRKLRRRIKEELEKKRREDFDDLQKLNGEILSNLEVVEKLVGRNSEKSGRVLNLAAHYHV